MSLANISSPSAASQSSATELCPACGCELDVSGQLPLAAVDCPVCGTRITVLQQFGELTIRGKLGQGGMGAVYRAFEPSLEREVALKLLRPEFVQDASQLAQLESEALIMAALSHPNVVRIFSMGNERGLRYLSMEVVEHGSLATLLDEEGQIPEARILRIALDSANGLASVYSRGLIHRDVKPGNILFDGSGCAKIVDFGLATQATAQQTDEEVFGSPFYLSPERVTGVQEDFRSDIYSLGATLFHAAAGRPPFDAPTATQVAMKHGESRAPKLRTYAPHISSVTASIIDRMLQRDRENRYQNYQELIDDLTYAQNQIYGGVAEAAAPVAQTWKSLTSEEDKQQALLSWIVIGMLALAVLGGGAYFLWPKKQEEVARAAVEESEPDRLLREAMERSEKKEEPPAKKEEPKNTVAAAPPEPSQPYEPSAAALQGTLLHEYDFEDGSEGGRDTVGGLTLNLIKGAKLVPNGVDGKQCLELNRDTGAKAAIYLPDSGISSLSGLSAVTFSAWVNVAAYPRPGTSTTARATVVTMLIGGEQAKSSVKYWTRCNFTVDGRGEVNVTVRKLDSDQSAAVITPANVVPLGKWTHIVVSADYSAANAKHCHIRVFVNGEAVTTTPFSRALSPGSTTSDTPSLGLVIGSNYPDQSTSEQFHGLIDKVQIYNKVLGTEEVRDLYSKHRP